MEDREPVATAQVVPGLYNRQERFRLAIVAIARRNDLDEEQRSASVLALRSEITDLATLRYYKNGVVQYVASPHAPYDLALRMSILKAMSPDSMSQVAMYRKIIAEGALAGPEKQALLAVLPDVGS